MAALALASGTPKVALILPLTTLLWANLHGSFILAFVLMGSALLFGAGDRKQLVIWTGLSLLSTFINPRGIFVWQFVSDMLNSASDQLFATEWGPPVNAGWQMNIFAHVFLFPPAISRRLSWNGIWFLSLLAGARLALSRFMFIMAILRSFLLSELLSSNVRR
jgi:hypothetical protein